MRRKKKRIGKNWFMVVITLVLAVSALLAVVIIAELHSQAVKDDAVLTQEKNFQEEPSSFDEALSADDNDTDTSDTEPTPDTDAARYYRQLFQSESAHTIVDVSAANERQIAKLFYQTKITKKIFRRIYGKSYKENCTVPKSELRYIRVLHYGFDEETHIGELIANKAIAKDLCDIFYELYREKYQIEKMVLVDEYDAEDQASMEDNNTSCFNFRMVSGTQHLSNHSYGRAIDINPLYNPYIYTLNGETVCSPAGGEPYQDRSREFAHKITEEDLCYQVFTEHGFTWGGQWINSKDYQHFQKQE